MLTKSVLVLTAFVTIATSVDARSIAATPVAATVSAAPIKNTAVVAPPTAKVLRTIPASLNWTCSSSLGEYTCTDPKTGKSYVCTNADASGARMCEVGDDRIPGSTV